MIPLSFAQNSLPQILSQTPTERFEELGPVSASEHRVEDARVELARQAQKLEADAVILKSCEPASIKRDGLTWNSVPAFCEGMAIKTK